MACHVDPGEIARFKHKFVALKEVQSHITGDTKFPRPAFSEGRGVADIAVSALESSQVAAVGVGKANLPGHAVVSGG